MFNTNKLQKTCEYWSGKYNSATTCWPSPIYDFLSALHIYTALIKKHKLKRKKIKTKYTRSWKIKRNVAQNWDLNTEQPQIWNPSSFSKQSVTRCREDVRQCQCTPTWFPEAFLQSSWNTRAKRCGYLWRRRSETWSCRGTGRKTWTPSAPCQAWWLWGPGSASAWRCRYSEKGTRTPAAAQRRENILNVWPIWSVGVVVLFMSQIKYRQCVCIENICSFVSALHTFTDNIIFIFTSPKAIGYIQILFGRMVDTLVT